MDEYERQVQEEQHYKPKLFTWPDWKTPSAIFDFEDLENDETFMVFCVRAKPAELEGGRKDDMVYVWHGSHHLVSQEKQSEF